MTSCGFFKKKARRPERFFNMVECALALAVVAIGVVSIVALFPVGMEATRDAIADSYAADAADGFLHYQASLGKTSGGWASLIGLTSSSTDNASTTWTDKGLIPGTTTRFYEVGSGSGLFKLEMTPDFSGVFRLWKSTLTNIPENIAIGLNMEVSWPSQAPYPKRKRALYYLEVFNPNN